MTTSDFFQRSELRRALWVFRREFLVVGIFSMVANLMMLAPTLYMLQVFDRVMLSQSELTLVLLSLITLFMFAVGAFSEWMRSRLLVSTGLRLDGLLSTRVFDASYESNLKQPSTGASKAFNDLIQLRQFLTGNGVFAFFDTPWTFVYWAVLYLLHPLLGVLAIIFALIQAALVWFGHRKTVKPAELASLAASEETAYVQSKLRNVEVLEPMGIVPNLLNRWQVKHQLTIEHQGNAQALSHRITAWSKFIRYAQQSLSLAGGALLVIDGQMSPGAMIAANVLMTRTLAPIDQLANTWRGFLNARSAFGRLEQIIEQNPERDVALRRVAPAGSLELVEVVATAPDRVEPILKNISLTAAPGSVTVVLGPSGSGKSTLARCMIGIWPYMSGEVLLDERPIRGWDRDELGPYIGYLPQDIELFDGSIAENIARFTQIDSSKVIAAAQAAGLHDMILRFPKGYDTSIGEAGNLLSGGQRQRIGLARAIYGQPSLLVLDEPNANLDDVGEAALVKAVEALKSQGSTILIITHRPGILAVADRVVVLKDGKIHANGPKDQVLTSLRQQQRTPQNVAIGPN